jgi:hypothetical protein
MNDSLKKGFALTPDGRVLPALRAKEERLAPGRLYKRALEGDLDAAEDFLRLAENVYQHVCKRQRVAESL